MTKYINEQAVTVQYIPMSAMQKKQGGRSRNAIYDAVSRGIIPPPIKVGKRIFWIESEVDEAMAKEAATAKRVGV